uniref:PIN domain-containing protein n=1 Tax=Gracilinema caldarium TaxID=215591 RepID=A0A7C3IQ42_9SPIR
MDLLKRKPLLRIDEETGAIYSRLAADLCKQGKSSNYRIMDLWLASQAIQYNLLLLTWNLIDFKDIPGLSVVSP